MWVENKGKQKQYNVGDRVVQIPPGVSEHDENYALTRLVDVHPDLSKTKAPAAQEEKQAPEPAKKKSKKKSEPAPEPEEESADTETAPDEDQS